MQASDVYYWGACNNLPSGQGGSCSELEIISALNWAVNSLGARGVVNMSLGGSNYSSSFANAVAAAWQAGHVIVAAAGNNVSNQTFYPAAYSNVVGVSGLNEDLSFAAAGTTACSGGYSNFGNHVDISAPFDVITTEPFSSYSSSPVCGTSFATPHVSGAAVLVRAANPTFDNVKTVEQLLWTAQDLGTPGFDTQFGNGVLRADLAAGLYTPTLTASIVSQKPRLSWNAIPLAQTYRIYRRVTPTLAPNWTLWATTSAVSYTDAVTKVASFYGYSIWPSAATAVSYYVVALSSGGIESPFLGMFATFIPIGVPPL